MIVLDASAVVEVVADQRDKTWVLEQMTGQDLCAPAHQVAEVLSALARLHGAGVVERTGLVESVDDAIALEQDLVLPTSSHVRRALELADRVRVVDGLYVALADDRRCPLVTTDRRLARAGLGVDIRSPG